MHSNDLEDFGSSQTISLASPSKFSKNSKSTTANIRMLGDCSGIETLDSKLDSNIDSKDSTKEDSNSLDSTQSVESNNINPHEVRTLKACSGEEGVVKSGVGANALPLVTTPFSPFKDSRVEDNEIVEDSKGLEDINNKSPLDSNKLEDSTNLGDSALESKQSKFFKDSSMDIPLDSKGLAVSTDSKDSSMESKLDSALDSKDSTNLKDSNKYLESLESKQVSTYQPNLASSTLSPDFAMRDIFGFPHRFFRPYTHKLDDYKVRILPFGYAYTMGDELVWTRSKKALISFTSQRLHPFAIPKDYDKKGKLAKFKILFTLFIRWVKFYTKRAKKLDASVALLTRNVQDSYGHFIREVMGGFCQLRLAGLEPDYYVIAMNTPFQREMMELLGIDESRIIPSAKFPLIRARELILPTLLADYEIVEYRKYMHFRGLCHPLFIKDMYKNMGLVSPNKQVSFAKIFITRPANSNRNIENLYEVESIFKSFGYSVILPDKLSLKEQIEIFSKAKIIASMHGSGLNNIIFAQDDVIVFEIFSKYYHDCNPSLVALLKRARYFYMVGESRDTSMHPQQENVYVNKQDLEAALEKLENIL